MQIVGDYVMDEMSDVRKLKGSYLSTIFSAGDPVFTVMAACVKGYNSEY